MYGSARPLARLYVRTPLAQTLRKWAGRVSDWEGLLKPPLSYQEDSAAF
jgi:hypothetical protein